MPIGPTDPMRGLLGENADLLGFGGHLLRGGKDDKKKKLIQMLLGGGLAGFM